jgi:hypothetical protein
MKNIDDHYACSRPSHKCAQKSLNFQRALFPAFFSKSYFLYK